MLQYGLREEQNDFSAAKPIVFFFFFDIFGPMFGTSPKSLYNGMTCAAVVQYHRGPPMACALYLV
jgi:hypothetical protein